MQRPRHVRREQDERVGVPEGEGYSAATSIEKHAGYNACRRLGCNWARGHAMQYASSSTARACGPVGSGAVGLHAARGTGTRAPRAQPGTHPREYRARARWRAPGVHAPPRGCRARARCRIAAAIADRNPAVDVGLGAVAGVS